MASASFRVNVNTQMGRITHTSICKILLIILGLIQLLLIIGLNIYSVFSQPASFFCRNPER